MAGQHADLAAPRTLRSRSQDRSSISFSVDSFRRWLGGVKRSGRPERNLCINDGDTHNTPVEAGEGKGADFYCLPQATAGLRRPGKISWRAGRSPRGPIAFSRQRSVRHGADDLRSLGAARRQRCVGQPLQRPSQGRLRCKSYRRVKLAGHVTLEAGDGFLVEVGGGGGFWNPLERDPQKVLADVRSGYVSL